MDRIGLIASDMDFTLLDEHSQLPPGFEQMVLDLEGEEILFAAASGRPLYTLEKMFPTLHDHMAFIADNGGVVRWKDETIYESRMPVEEYRAMARYCHEAGDVGVVCGMECAYVEERYQQYDRVLRKFYTNITYVEDLTALDVAADKYTIYLPRDNARAAYDDQYGPGFGQRFSVAVAGDCWVDIMNQGVNKGSALELLGRRRGLSPDGIMAFGDTYNDTEMLTTARYGFLMSNGSKDLRARVPYLAPPHWDHGVMQVLAQVLRQGGLVTPRDFTPAH